MNKAHRFLLALFSLRTRSTWGPFVETYESTRFDHAFTASWSQRGEDLALTSIFNPNMIGTYIDVGAHHPSRFSTTRALYERGWSGINVEANPDLMDEFTIQRPRDKNLNYAVGKSDYYELQVFDEPALSTYVNDWTERFLSEGATLRKSVRVPGISLRSLFDQYFPDQGPDLLCIDAEGSDFEVLLSLDLPELDQNRRPFALLLETVPPIKHSLQTDSVKYAMKNGYIPHLVLPMATILLKE